MQFEILDIFSRNILLIVDSNENMVKMTCDNFFFYFKKIFTKNKNKKFGVSLNLFFFLEANFKHEKNLIYF